MDKQRIVYKLGNVLEEQGIYNSRLLAEDWVDKAKGKTEFFDEQDRETLEFIKSVVDIREIENPRGFADAFINGNKNIQEVYNYLLNYYTKDELKDQYKRNFELFAFKLDDVQTVADYLKTVFEQENLKYVLVKAIVLGIDVCKKRNEFVLKHFGDKDFLTYLAKDCELYYPYHYSDIIGGISYILEELGTEKARKLLEENEMFLMLYRRPEYRMQYKTMFDEAMEIVDRYR